MTKNTEPYTVTRKHNERWFSAEAIPTGVDTVTILPRAFYQPTSDSLALASWVEPLDAGWTIDEREGVPAEYVGQQGWWVRVPSDLVSEPVRRRPTMNVSDRPTALAYAVELSAPATPVLWALARGEDVDAFEVQQELFSEGRHLAEHTGLRKEKRQEVTRKLAHLSYIASAIVSNHIDGLPTYENGERSRLVEKQKAELEAVRSAVEDARSALDESTETVRELKAALAFATRDFTDEESAQVEAFREGWKKGRK